MVINAELFDICHLFFIDGKATKTLWFNSSDPRSFLTIGCSFLRPLQAGNSWYHTARARFSSQQQLSSETCQNGVVAGGDHDQPFLSYYTPPKNTKPWTLLLEKQGNSRSYTVVKPVPKTFFLSSARSELRHALAMMQILYLMWWQQQQWKKLLLAEGVQK